MNRRHNQFSTFPQYKRVEYLQSCTGGQNDVRSYMQVFLNYDLSVDSIVFETEHELTDLSRNNLELYSLDGHALNWGYLVSDGYVVRYDSESDKIEKTHRFSQEPGFHVWRLECSARELKLLVDGVQVLLINLSTPLIHQKSWPLTIFGVITEESIHYSSWPLNCKKKYFRVWKNDELIYDLIPVLDSTDTPCMFNRTNGCFLYNMGEDEFVCGSVIET